MLYPLSYGGGAVGDSTAAGRVDICLDVGVDAYPT